MAAKKKAEPTEFRFKVLVDNFADGDEGSVVVREPDAHTAALVEAGVLEPLSKAATEAVEDA